MQVTRVIACILLVVLVSQTSWAHMHNLVQGRGRILQLCGQHLNRFMEKLCNGRYNKRMYGSELDEDSLEGDIFQSNVPAADSWSTSRFQRPVRGIVQECCRKPCSEANLREYCADY